MRLPNAAERVDAAINEARGWPGCDFGCLDLVGHVAAAITGEDRRALFPAYSTQEEADAIIGQFGGLAGILTHAFGEPIAVRKALKGDPVLVDIDGETVGGVIVGVEIAFRMKGGGITFRSIKLARLAWSVG